MSITPYPSTTQLLDSVAAAAFAILRQVDPAAGEEARASYSRAVSTLATVQAAAAELSTGAVSRCWAMLAERTHRRALLSFAS